MQENLEFSFEGFADEYDNGLVILEVNYLSKLQWCGVSGFSQKRVQGFVPQTKGDFFYFY